MNRQPMPPIAKTSRRMLRWQVLTLLLMVVGYAGCYLCRSNFSIALPQITQSLVEQGYSLDQARVRLGTVASLGVLGYALGKFVTGSLADVLGGRRNVLMGMVGSVAFTILFALGGSVPWFSLAWIGNRMVQSLCWTGMVKVTSKWFSFSAYGTAMGVISLSYLFGDAAARRFMGWLLEAGFGWRAVFLAAGGGLFGFFLLNLVWLKESPVAINEPEPPINPLNLFGPAGEMSRPASLRELLVPLLRSREFIVVCLLSLGLTLMRETFNTWTPTYFREALGLSDSQAANHSAWFPLLGGVSVLLAGWLSDRLGHGGRAAVIFCGCLLSAAVLLALGYYDFTSASLAPVGLVGLVGFLMIGPYSYLAGAISLDLGGKQGSGTACGIIDGVGYLGAILAGDSVARVSVAYGWPGAFKALAGVALLTTFGAAVFFRIQRNVPR
jgi:sugar phosphate permease